MILGKTGPTFPYKNAIKRVGNDSKVNKQSSLTMSRLYSGATKSDLRAYLGKVLSCQELIDIQPSTFLGLTS